MIGWPLDFCRKINEHSRFRRFLLKLVLGKYAWRELIGMRDGLDKEGWDPYFEYTCEDVDYHKEKVRW